MSAVLQPEDPTPAVPAVSLGVPTPSPVADTVPTGSTADVPAETLAERARWCERVGQVGAEVAGPLTSALERVLAMVTSGQIDQAGLRALRAEIESARRTGMQSQQLAWLASGRVRQSHERVHLTHALQVMLGQRAAELQTRGLQVRESLQDVEVIVDAPLLYTLLDAWFDWVLGCCCGRIELGVNIRDWPAHGRVQVRFAWLPADRACEAQASQPPGYHTLAWELVQAAAQAMGVQVERRLDGPVVHAGLDFPRTVTALVDLEAEHGLDAASDSRYVSSLSSRPLDGCQVLVVAARREVKVPVREALRDTGVTLDFVGSLDEAVAFCDAGLQPQAVIVDSAHHGKRCAQWLQALREHIPGLVVVEIGEDGHEVQPSPLRPDGCARVGRGAVAESLASALVFELARSAG